jgi:hypothetical protein
MDPYTHTRARLSLCLFDLICGPGARERQKIAYHTHARTYSSYNP